MCQVLTGEREVGRLKGNWPKVSHGMGRQIRSALIKRSFGVEAADRCP
jgi:hypothetical protein